MNSPQMTQMNTNFYIYLWKSVKSVDKNKLNDYSCNVNILKI